MNKLAFLFPGQGSQYLGMGWKFAQSFKTSADIFQQANETLSYDIAKLCFEGPEKKLTETEYAQPAILTVSVAILKVIEEQGMECDITAGLSLGEYTALVCANALEFSDAVKVVRKRGKYMQEAVPLGEGAMAAIVGLPIDKLEEIIRSSNEPGIVGVANYNTHDQIVISGEKKAVRDLVKIVKENGASRAVLLPVSAPFHCSLLKPAQEKLEKELEKIYFNKLKIPIVSNVGAQIVNDSSEIAPLLIKQVTSSILWKDSVEVMLEYGVDTFVEIGPGDTLTKFVNKIAQHNKRAVVSFNISTPQELQIFLDYYCTNIFRCSR